MDNQGIQQTLNRSHRTKTNKTKNTTWKTYTRSNTKTPCANPWGYIDQGRIQDFKLGDALKIIARKFLGYFV